MKLKNRLLKKEKRMIKYELSHADKIIIFVLGSIGLVSLWRGLWSYLDSAGILSNPAISVLFGISLLILTGWVVKRD